MSDITPPENTVLPYSEPQKAPPNLIMSIGRSIPAIITVILGLGAISSGAGYVIVNMNLTRFTDIQGFSIHPSQYVAAGLFLIVGSALITTGLMVFMVSVNLLLDGVMWIIEKLLVLFYRRSLKFRAWADKYFREPLRKFFRNTERYEKFNKLDRFVNSKNFLKLYLGGYSAIFFVWIIVATFNSDIYSQFPRWVGGGEPSSMVLVFKDAESLQHLGLTPSVSVANRADTLLFLAELTDGVLVIDTTNGQVSAVQNDLLLGRMNPAQIYPEALQTFIPTLRPAFMSPTPSVTSTPLPTFTATATIP